MDLFKWKKRSYSIVLELHNFITLLNKLQSFLCFSYSYLVFQIHKLFKRKSFFLYIFTQDIFVKQHPYTTVVQWRMMWTRQCVDYIYSMHFALFSVRENFLEHKTASMPCGFSRMFIDGKKICKQLKEMSHPEPL